MNRTGVIFCLVSLALTAAAMVLGFQLAALSPEELQAARTPTPPEQLPDVELPGFGKVAVMDMMLFYVENPPAPPTEGAADAPPAARHFGGC